MEGTRSRLKYVLVVPAKVHTLQDVAVMGCDSRTEPQDWRGPCPVMARRRIRRARHGQLLRSAQNEPARIF